MIMHMCLDVAGWLQSHTRKRDYTRMFKRDDGRWMTPDEAKRNLLEVLASGRRLLPLGPCDGFDYQTGCPGHEKDAA